MILIFSNLFKLLIIIRPKTKLSIHMQDVPHMEKSAMRSEYFTIRKYSLGKITVLKMSTIIKNFLTKLFFNFDFGFPCKSLPLQNPYPQGDFMNSNPGLPGKMFGLMPRGGGHKQLELIETLGITEVVQRAL